MPVKSTAYRSAIKKEQERFLEPIWERPKRSLSRYKPLGLGGRQQLRLKTYRTGMTASMQAGQHNLR
jgi:hypothetical protein